MRAEPEDVGDQALMRGLDTAFPCVRPGLSLSKRGRRSCDRPHSLPEDSPHRGPAPSTARMMSRRTDGLALSAVTQDIGQASETLDATYSGAEVAQPRHDLDRHGPARQMPAPGPEFSTQALT